MQIRIKVAENFNILQVFYQYQKVYMIFQYLEFNFNMIYNDKDQTKYRDSYSQDEQPFVLKTEEDQQNEDIPIFNNNQNKISFNNINMLKLDHPTKKPPLPFNRFKKQQFNLITANESTNNENDSSQKKGDKFTESKNKSNQIKIQEYSSKASLNSSGKISNLRFTSPQQQNDIHPQTKKFVQKYFPTYQNSYSSHFICLQDFINLLFEEYEEAIGKQNAGNFYNDFTQKIQQKFGNQIFFDDLFEKTIQKGMIGLIFEVFKQIQQDYERNRNQKYKNRPLRQVFSINNKNLQSKQKMNTHASFKLGQLSQSSTKSSRKISLNQIFGGASRVNQDNVNEIKQILVQYLESMYEEAEHQISKKFSAQLRKITSKCKQAEHILQKINDKVSNHYSMLNMEKQYQKKIKTLNEKLNEQESKIKQFQFTISSSKQSVQKQKSINFQLTNQIQKLNKKLQKYENAILEKAFSNKQNSSSRLNSLTESNSNCIDQKYGQSKQNSQQIKQPTFFKFQVDTVTQHSPMPTQTYTPYHSRMNNHNPQYGTSPIIQDGQRHSVSPIYQRVTFNNQTDKKNNINRPVSPIGKLNQDVGHTSYVQNSNMSRIIINSVNTNLSAYQQSKVNTGYQGQQYQRRTHSPINIPFSTSRVITLSPARKN